MKRFIPLILIVVLMLVGYLSGIYKALSFETLRYQHLELREYATAHPILAPCLFLGTYLFATALSFPSCFFLSILGGYLFAQPWATLYVIMGATIGSTLLFWAARTAIGNWIGSKGGARLVKVEENIQKNAPGYLLFLRIVPFFPFWMANLLPALFRIPLRTYIWTTLVGMSIGSFLLTETGRGFHAIFEGEADFSFSSIFTAEVNTILLCLGVLISLTSVFLYKIFQKFQSKYPEKEL